MRPTMKKPSPFHEGKPRTPRGEARQRENDTVRAIQDLLQLGDVAELTQRLKEHYGIVPGTPKYDQILAIWKEYQIERP
jgi:hypothetical protein